MSKGLSRKALEIVCAAMAVALWAPPARAQFGLAIGGVGPINRAMGGASTAAPIDAAGALYWNVATISALPRSEMEVATEILIPRTTLSSKVPANAFGPGLPSGTLAGTTGGNNGVFVLPTVGLVYRPEKSPWTFGFGIFEVGGFAVNYPADRRNPILNPQFPFGRGIGPLVTQYQNYQFAPSAAYQINDEWSVGLAADIDYAYFAADPALFATPTLVNSPLGPGPVYTQATHGRFRGGGGFQAGVFYNPDSDWSFGASFKSPQWFETYTFNAVNALGQTSRSKFNLDFPWIASVGTSYTGFDRALIALDLRYVDYRDTEGFKHTGFDQTGALRGLGWQSVFALALGGQYMATDRLALRAGYTFGLNPVGNAVTAFNVGSPTIIQHTVSTGLSYDVTPAFKLSLAYVHFFQSQNEGPIIQPFTGSIPGSVVRSASTADSVLFGATVAF